MATGPGSVWRCSSSTALTVPLRTPFAWEVSLATRPEPSPAVTAFTALAVTLFPTEPR